MSAGQTIILSSPWNRAQAKRLIDAAPPGAVLNVREAKRTIDQNSLLWALLSQISRAKPEGRVLPTEKWKCVFMDACGFKADWIQSLDGESVVNAGYRSSHLTKADFSNLIECIHAYAAEQGIPLSDEPESQIKEA